MDDRDDPDDGGTFLQGVYLTAQEADRARLIAAGASFEALSSWSTSPTLTLRNQTAHGLAFAVTIGNLGLTDSLLTTIKAVVWTSAQSAAVVDVAHNIAIPARATIHQEFELGFPLLLDDGRTLSLAEVTHVYCVVEDPLFDPIDAAAQRLLVGGRFDDHTSPCRESRLVVGWVPSLTWLATTPFGLASGAPTGVEIALISRSAGTAARFGIASPVTELWTDDLLAAPIGRVIYAGSLPADPIVFALESSPHLFRSDDPHRCRIRRIDDAITELRWEDSRDADWNDYILRLIRR
jgi:hypothetical protein